MTRARAESVPPAPRAAFAAAALHKPLRALRRELAGVRRNEDSECVHRMRVATRRLRNTLALFADELPAPARTRWAKRLKAVTKALGEARDLDVQILFLRQYLAGLDTSRARQRPGIEHLLAARMARRDAVQSDVCSALDRLEASGAPAGLAAWVKTQLARAGTQPAEADDLRAEAGRAVRHRLGALFAYEPYVEQPAAIAELHAMRIAAKRLRYTLEVYAPLYADGLAAQIKWGKRLQDWLGEIHDCDVWRDQLAALLAESGTPAPPRGRRTPAAARLRPGLEHLRAERRAHRAAVYAEFRAAWRQAAGEGFWDEFRRPFIELAPAAAGATDARTAATDAVDERLAPVLQLARACRYEVAHTHQVTRLAQRLFAQLAELHGLGAEHGHWLTCASLLHDIGWSEGRAGHHKTAQRLIMQSPGLPWNERQRRIVGLIARYHRKALPRADDAHFADLSAADRAAVCKLAAILRLADALDYTHTSAVEDVACRATPRRISVRCTARRSIAVERARALEKGDLAVQVFDRELNVTWRQR